MELEAPDHWTVIELTTHVTICLYRNYERMRMVVITSQYYGGDYLWKVHRVVGNGQPPEKRQEVLYRQMRHRHQAKRIAQEAMAGKI